MKNVNKKAFFGLFFLIFVLGVALFTPAWTFRYWQAWCFLAVFSLSVLAITIYLMIKDPKLLERRVRAGPGAEKERKQKIIQFVAQIAFILVIIFPAFDHRFGWSYMPAFISIIGDVFVALGLLMVFFVFKENTYTSAIIDVENNQKIISSGPYALVRHPMYIGAIIMLMGIPIALGSWWGLLAVVPITIVIVLRLLDEEKYLGKHLSGYIDYKRKVKYRLVPFLW